MILCLQKKNGIDLLQALSNSLDFFPAFAAFHFPFLKWNIQRNIWLPLLLISFLHDSHFLFDTGEFSWRGGDKRAFFFQEVNKRTKW